MSDGFGWNFYGFFVVAALWCAVYFGWAVATNNRERDASARRRDDDER